ncbi:hypothetical protein ACWT_2856 [Actinoplanes sp. SE50]|uniref:DUF58 domain-containing protein n=1 Tax=unclassified Actinoplanes TaxID=2626549 RepID=UPI00023EC429|nr:MULTISPECIES: DUF58 domain-containing protein [unclassified Actinoplanes]AEV83585.1 hypothetical protein ACPL_2690 [Actinoplanes sp. SE50/110]ATO82271.1 hypothetical protein ACWT_2856 [Actinoplanes sp. SE50]SLL99678.1 hypothetical protein ACSP50_2909 [Actinoplanes sp. SE50/110]
MTPNGVLVAVGGAAGTAGWLLLGYPAALVVALLAAVLLAAGVLLRLTAGGGARVELGCAVTRAERGDRIIVSVAADRRALVRLRIDPPGERVDLPIGRSPRQWTSPPLPRGRLLIVAEAVTVHDPFALWRRQLPFTSEAVHVTVMPRLLPLEAAPPFVDRQEDGRAASLWGPGVAFAGLREYEPGDDVRHIDWAASARAGDDRLYSRQFAPTLTDSLVVVLDHHAPAGQAGGFEDAVDLAFSFCRAGASLALSTSGRVWPAGAEADAQLLAVQPTTDARVLRPAARAGTTVVVTPDPGRRAALQPLFAQDDLILVAADGRAPLQWRRWLRR